MFAVNELTPIVQEAIQACFGFQPEEKHIQFQETRKEFEGDVTLVTFPFTKPAKKSPQDIAAVLGEYLEKNSPLVVATSVVKGFLNISLNTNYFHDLFKVALNNPKYGTNATYSGKSIMVEYSSPNTNKPLHLGHLRNNFLGYSVAEILGANGYDVKKVQIINDRGIHICKSMVAWQKFGGGETPESSGLKGDKLVGKYYVEFDQVYKAEQKELIEKGATEEEAAKQAPILIEAQEMLKKWEAKDAEVTQLWETMNGWVYTGFEATYNRMGVNFDKLYYESDTYILGKSEVEKGLEQGVFFKKEDGSVWIDLSEYKLDEKLLLRADGTSVYMTQDVGTAILRFKDFPEISGQIYTVGNEQEYHFNVLFLILKKLGYEWAEGCYHLSYGMVDLPSGKMKSREGTVVDADDLMQEMVDTASATTEELGKLDELSAEDKATTHEMIGLGALKYFLLRVDPKKRMLFNPAESIDFNGNTGPFIQYTHARICSLLRKAEVTETLDFTLGVETGEAELNVVKALLQFPAAVHQAGEEYSPAVIANYVYDLVKQFNHFYQTTPVLKDENPDRLNFKLALCQLTGRVIASGMELLGIQVPERM